MSLTVAQFQHLLDVRSSNELADQFILSGNSAHVSADDLKYVASYIRSKFALEPDDMEVRAVGSAHLGFALVPKKQDNETIKPRYRLFQEDSDIDVVIISPKLYVKIWNDIQLYSHNQLQWPWTSSRCGDYHVCGWLRSDKFQGMVYL
jgi:hypothetical protein